MTVLTATQLKSRLGEYMEQAQREPIIVKKGGRKYAVIISQEDFERFQALEDRYWAEKARKAQKSGYIGTEAAMAALKKCMDEE